MAGIEEYLDKIKNAVYGRDVRDAIHDGIHQCYEDGKAGAVDLVAREEIAELIAPSGEAPSAAEVTDARIGADGTTYTSLGLANRTQFSGLQEGLDSVESSEMVRINPAFTEGKGINSSGAISNSAKRIASEGFIDTSKMNTIHYNITDGYRVYVAYYSSASESGFVSREGWLTGSGWLNVAGKYMRVCYASVGDASTMTAADAAYITIEHSYDLYYALAYKGAVSSESPTIATDIDDVNSIGIYNVPSTSVPANCPDGFNGGDLLVVNAYSTTSVKARSTQLMQILFSSVDSAIWARHNSSSGVWRDWQKLTSGVIEAIVTETKWLALGDSITYGVYSTGVNTKVDGTNGWVKRLADSFGYSLNNQGVRGMGFVAVGSNGIHWSDVLDTVDLLTDSYNLITVALGINDYNTSSVSLNDIESAIDTGIQRLMAKFPEARLVFITPLNSNRRGDASTQYCYKYEYGGRSLKDVADLIKSKCDSYGVECIYATNGFLLNTYNIATLLPDYTHPSDACHTLIAKNMAHYLLT